MTVLIAIDGNAPVNVLVQLPTWDASPSATGSWIMEIEGPNAPEVLATRLRPVESPDDATLRDVGVSDAAVLAWGRALPRYPGAEDMIDLDL